METFSPQSKSNMLWEYRLADSGRCKVDARRRKFVSAACRELSYLFSPATRYPCFGYSRDFAQTKSLNMAYFVGIAVRLQAKKRKFKAAEHPPGRIDDLAVRPPSHTWKLIF